ncbi:MAG: ABC transporter ATP-binding protein [Pseudomonadota bacterium]
MMELIGLSKAFEGKPAVVGLSLRVEDDEYLTLLGPSGSGKTTLLRLVAGLERPDSGRIVLNGEDITARPTHLRGLGFVQQNYALFPHFSVEENIAFGLQNRVVDRIEDGAELRRRVGDMLELVGLEGLGGRTVGQISGGQKQRVSLARTLITEPKVCLLDEPLGALDANLRERMTVELRTIRRQLGVTFFHVTGNEHEAIAMGDRMIVLDAGRAIQVDAPDTVFDRPRTVRVAKFVNSYNVLEGSVTDGLFRHGDVRVPVPSGASSARYIAVRYDLPRIEAEDAPVGEGRVGTRATFMTSEFMGSKVVYFFRAPDGAMLEVERHLSQSDPETIPEGETRFLSWRVPETLFFDDAGDRLEPTGLQGAA